MSAYSCVFSGFYVALVKHVRLSILTTVLYCYASLCNLFIRHMTCLFALVHQELADSYGKRIELFTANLNSTEQV
jgi:hypothetical protein